MSRLPISLTDSYWTEILRLLVEEHRLETNDAKDAIARYRNIIEQNDIGDIIYHCSTTETAAGIVVGGYAEAN